MIFAGGIPLKNIPKGKIVFAKSIDTLTTRIKVLVATPAPRQNP
jgi:hypothetical protein